MSSVSILKIVFVLKSVADEGGTDDINLVNGMPVGLQLVTGRFGEEKAVAIAKVMESLK